MRKRLGILTAGGDSHGPMQPAEADSARIVCADRILATRLAAADLIAAGGDPFR